MDRASRLTHIAHALRTLLLPGQWCEVRALHLGGQSGRHAHAFFNDVSAAAAWAYEQDEKRPKGVYVSLNPLREDIATSKRWAKGEDVVAIRWLLIDCEYRKGHSGQNASEEERTAAWGVVQRVLGTLSAVGIESPGIADSGNGWHVLVPVDLPATDEKAFCKAILAGLSERCSDELARVDPGTYQLQQGAKIYGTTARRGAETEGRPWRLSWLHTAPAEGESQRNTAALRRLLAQWKQAEDLTKGPERKRLDEAERERERALAYAKAALLKECEDLAGTPPGGRAAQCYASAAAVGNHVGAGTLSRIEAEQVLAGAARRCGLPDDEAAGHIRRGLETGMKTPRVAPETNGYHPAVLPIASEIATASTPATDSGVKRRTARLSDLAKAGAQIDHLWPGWIQRGVLTAIAAEGGRGKTRFCADLARRIRHQLPWPDGAPMTLPPETMVLWVVSDNHHDEMVSLGRAFDIEDSIAINAWDTDPYGGVTLDAPEDLHDLELRVEEVKPALVVIDTVGNSTDRNLSKQEEAKAYYQPLQLVARRHRCAILCLTHLNANGAFLGRRVLEKVRCAIRIEQPDPANAKRRIEVKKTNSKVPPPLGLIMGDHGNEYDGDPPAPAEAPARKPGGKPTPDLARVEAAKDWLREYLALGPRKVGHTISDGEQSGHTKDTLYAARESLEIEQYESGDRKWWRLPPTEIVPFHGIPD